MGLPWFRMDSNFASHDKILALLSDPSAARWQACVSYVSSIGWSNAAGSNGKVPRNALVFVHGTTKTARLLEKYRLWEEVPGGYRIVNFDKRNPLSEVREHLEQAKAQAGRKANCVRWHGDSCWQDDHCTKEGVA